MLGVGCEGAYAHFLYHFSCLVYHESGNMNSLSLLYLSSYSLHFFGISTILHVRSLRIYAEVDGSGHICGGRRSLRGGGEWGVGNRELERVRHSLRR